MDTRKAVIIGVSTVAAGAAAYGVYYYVKQRPGAPPVPVSCEATIEKKHVEYLAAKAAELTDGDANCVMRALLDYAVTDGDEKDIFESIRCNTCGGNKDKAENTSVIYATHAAYLEAMAAKHALKDGKSKALRVVCEYAMTDGDASAIFTPERLEKCSAV